MVGFDSIDRRFQPKPLIRLECVNCGHAGDSVVMTFPNWYNGCEKIPLCIHCTPLKAPTNPMLIEDARVARENVYPPGMG